MADSRQAMGARQAESSARPLVGKSKMGRTLTWSRHSASARAEIGIIAKSLSERTLRLRRCCPGSQAINRLPLEGLRVPSGGPQHVLA